MFLYNTAKKLNTIKSSTLLAYFLCLNIDQVLGNNNLIIVVPNNDYGEILNEEIIFFQKLLKKQILTINYPSRDCLPFDSVSPSEANQSERLKALYSLFSKEKKIIITTPLGLIEKVPSKKILEDHQIDIHANSPLSIQDLTNILEDYSFTSKTIVETPGDYSAKGAIIDVYATLPKPIRIEFDELKIKNIRLFDTESQISLNEISGFKLYPAKEIFFTDINFKNLENYFSDREIGKRDKFQYLEALESKFYWPGIENLMPTAHGYQDSLLQYLPTFKTLIVDQTNLANSLEHNKKLIIDRYNYAKEFLIPCSSINDTYDHERSFLNNTFNNSIININIDEANFQTNSDLTSSLILQRSNKEDRPYKNFASKLINDLENDINIITVSKNSKKSERIIHLLGNYNIKFTQSDLNEINLKKLSPATITAGFISSGFIDRKNKIRVISDREIIPEQSNKPHIKESKKALKKFISSLSQIKEDDYIVHIDRGIGIFKGLVQLSIEGKTADYLQLEYADGAKLFLPVEQLNKISKYRASEGKSPLLNKLGTNQWEKQKRETKAKIAELAGELINLYAHREVSKGHQFSNLSEEDQLFADQFEFDETEDQIKSISEILDDMNSEKPMDRLLCGDVGFGKTEVAMRAAFKAVSDGKQVALVVPTTILAEQHHQSFSKRFNNFGFEIGCISRFMGTKNNQTTIEKANKGLVDILIGTHRILQSDIELPNLGLLIIDEEHKFGVAQKERLKKSRTNIDVLSLSATPIPRTLNMSLSGIRDLSLIETPPHNRQLIQTFVGSDSDGLIKEAIDREMERNGQIFIINNKIGNIELIASRIKSLAPKATIEIGHGQMNKNELERVMHKFINNETQILISTTIIESGIDIQNANTIIILDADKFGVAELYQLRGRVGRSSTKAYAYLLVSSETAISDNAKKRLNIFKSLDDLGVGFRLALQDLEIRGAGHLLGKDQTGEISELGYDLYMKLLQETVEELKNGTPTQSMIDPEMSLGFSCFIPKYYLPDIEERLRLYQRLYALTNLNDLNSLISEIEDRFGTIPNEMFGLFYAVNINIQCKNLKIKECVVKNKRLHLTFTQNANIDILNLVSLAKMHPFNYALTPQGTISILIEDENIIYDGEKFIEFFQNAIKKFKII